jgi:hypothetical protein
MYPKTTGTHAIESAPMVSHGSTITLWLKVMVMPVAAMNARVNPA